LSKKSKQQENIFTPSGHQVDKDLMKVAVKVSPSMQALIANQIDLLEMLEGKVAKNSVLIEQHRVEVLQVEEEIANAFSSYVHKKEKTREQRLLKRQLIEESGKLLGEEQHMEDLQTRSLGNTAVPFDMEDETGIDKLASRGQRNKDSVAREDDRPMEHNMYFNIEPASQESGLPSSKYDTGVRSAAIKTAGVDVRRVALGVSIKALQSFLGRELNEEEIKSLENQVDLYLA